MLGAMRLQHLLVILALAACPSVPDDPPLKAMTPAAHEALFPIVTGAHGGADCDACHGEFDTFSRFTCISCHEHAQARVDGSHLGSVTGYAYTATSCLECHPRGEAEGFDHTRFFPISAGTPHAGIPCASCHVDPANRRVVDCVTCHTDAATTPLHAAVTGYEWASPACLICHPDGTASGAVDHARFFPIAAGTRHAGIACATCHVNPADRTIVSCANACHAQAASSAPHGDVGGYQWTDALCLRCHADAQVHAVAAHLPFRIQVEAKHHRESCVACHPSNRADKPWGADFQRPKVACASCHAPSKDTHFNQPALTCLNAGCHPTGSD